MPLAMVIAGASRKAAGYLPGAAIACWIYYSLEFSWPRDTAFWLGNADGDADHFGSCDYVVGLTFKGFYRA